MSASVYLVKTFTYVVVYHSSLPKRCLRHATSRSYQLILNILNTLTLNEISLYLNLVYNQKTAKIV